LSKLEKIQENIEKMLDFADYMLKNSRKNEKEG
jgi:hypothetical protein